MADNTETPGMDGFSISDTMNMGAGNQEMINDLLGAESSDNLEPIIKDAEPAGTPPKQQKKPEPGKSDDEDPKPKPSTSIQDFLSGGEEEEEEGEREDPSKKPKAAENALEGVEEGAEGEGEEDGEEGEGGNGEATQFTALANELTSLGVFSEAEEGDEPITDGQGILDKFQAEKQKGSVEMVNNFIGQFGEDYQNAFNSIFVNGVDPKEYFESFNKVKSFTNMDLSVENNQRAVLKKALTNQGYEDEDINAEIERIHNYGDLETSATRHHKVLVKNETENLAQIEEKSANALKEKSAVKQEYVTNVQKILGDKLKEKGFDGIPLNPKLANELHDFLLVDKYKTPTGETLTDFDRTILDLKKPENHSTKVKIGLLLKMLEKDPTLSTIQKTGVTKKTNSMFKEVVRHVPKLKGSNKKNEPTKWFK